MPVSPAEREFILSQIGRFAETDLNNLWRQAEQLGTDEFFSYVRDGFVEIATTYHQTTGQLAATWFEESDPLSPYIARVAEPVSPDRLLRSAEWALGGDGERGLARMQGSMQRAVYDGARETVLINAEETRSRWVRVTRPNACEFCRMLATRSGDYAYLSRESATSVGRSRREGGRKMGSRFHDDCYCTAVEVRASQAIEDVLTEDKLRLYEQWSDEYDKAVANAGTTDTKKVLAAWREQTASTPPATPASGPLDRAVLDSSTSVEQVASFINGKYGIDTDGFVDSPMAKGIPIEESLAKGRDVFSAARAAKERQMDARTAREFGQAVDDVLTKYPFLKLDAIRADYAPYGDPLSGEAYAQPKLDAEFKKIGARNVTISALVDEKGKEGTEWKRRQLAMLQQDSRYAASTYERPVYAVIVHEMGHVMDFNSGGNAIPAAQAAIRKYVAGLPGAPARNTPEFELFEARWLQDELVSAYSFETREGEPFSRDNPVYWVEALAEAFADVEIRGDEAEVASKIIHEAMVSEARKFSTPPKSTLELLNEIKLPGVDF